MPSLAAFPALEILAHQVARLEFGRTFVLAHAMGIADDHQLNAHLFNLYGSPIEVGARQQIRLTQYAFYRHAIPMSNRVE